MSSAKLVKSKDVHTRDELADLLELLAVRVRAGELVFEHGSEQLVVPVPDSLRVGLEVSESTKPTKVTRKLEIDVKWQVEEDADAPTG